MYFIIWTSGSIVHHIFISVNFANLTPKFTVLDRQR